MIEILESSMGLGTYVCCSFHALSIGLTDFGYGHGIASFEISFMLEGEEWDQHFFG